MVLLNLVGLGMPIQPSADGDKRNTEHLSQSLLCDPPFQPVFFESLYQIIHTS